MSHGALVGLSVLDVLPFSCSCSFPGFVNTIPCETPCDMPILALPALFAGSPLKKAKKSFAWEWKAEMRPPSPKSPGRFRTRESLSMLSDFIKYLWP